jgi:hypothetical protein
MLHAELESALTDDFMSPKAENCPVLVDQANTLEVGGK